MGTFSVPVRVSNVAGQRTKVIDMTVDTGATFCLLPAKVLRDLEVKVVREERFSLAEKSSVLMPVGWISLRVDGKEAFVPTVFGPEDAEPLLGAIALEALLMAADPVNKQLVPVTGKLL